MQTNEPKQGEVELDAETVVRFLQVAGQVEPENPSENQEDYHKYEPAVEGFFLVLLIKIESYKGLVEDVGNLRDEKSQNYMVCVLLLDQRVETAGKRSGMMEVHDHVIGLALQPVEGV